MPPYANHKLPWTEDEDDFVRQWNGTAEELSIALGRTPVAVTERRKIIRHPHRYDSQANDTTQAYAEQKQRRWEPDEDSLVLAKEIPDLDLSLILGRTYYAVQQRRRVLKKTERRQP